MNRLISGIILLLSGKFHTGEKIKFDSTVGKVVNIGWTDTTIQGITRILVYTALFVFI